MGRFSTVRRTRPFPVVLALVALTGACDDGPTDPDPMAPPLPGGWIYFMEDGVADGESRVDLFRIRADGTGRERIAAPDYDYAVAYDVIPETGRLVVLAVTSDPFRTHLLVMNGDGSNVVDLTADDPDFRGEGASWSPDAGAVAFHDVSDAGVALATLALDGTRSVLDDQEVSFGFRARWSPDGGRIAYSVRSGEGRPQLALIDADGSNRTVVDAIEIGPEIVWAPGGDRLIVPGRVDPDDPLTLHEISADGATVTALTPDGFETSSMVRPWVSADGEWITFVAGGDGPTAGAYRMRHDGTDVELLLAGASFAVLSPDASFFVAVSAFDLRVRWVEGGSPVTLAAGGDAFDPTWIP